MESLHERLLQNYGRFLEEDLQADSDRRQRLADRSATRSDDEEEVSVNPNPFYDKEAPNLPHWKRTVFALLDAEDKPLRDRLAIFHTMAKAYSNAVASHSPTAFLNYVLHITTQEAADALGHSRIVPPHTLRRLKQVASLWYNALLQGYERCQLVGFQDRDPWTIWEGMQTTVPVPELWRSMVLQYCAYEAQYNHIYGCFLIKDMYAHRTAIGSDGTAIPGSSARASLFVQQTYDFSRQHDETCCLGYSGNPLFQRRYIRCQ